VIIACKMGGGFRVFAVARTNTVSFGIHPDQARTVWLAGIRDERIDLADDERYYVPSFKMFPSIFAEPDQDTYVSTYAHPIQSLVRDDFTAEPAHDYIYVFHPLTGTPKKLDRSRPRSPSTTGGPPDARSVPQLRPAKGSRISSQHQVAHRPLHQPLRPLRPPRSPRGPAWHGCLAAACAARPLPRSL
jgi:hypothetical protein